MGKIKLLEGVLQQLIDNGDTHGIYEELSKLKSHLIETETKRLLELFKCEFSADWVFENELVLAVNFLGEHNLEGIPYKFLPRKSQLNRTFYDLVLGDENNG